MGLDPSQFIDACHLIADTLGGSGGEVRNIGAAGLGGIPVS